MHSSIDVVLGAAVGYLEKISPRGLAVIRQRDFSLLTSNSVLTEEKHCSLEQKVINNLKFIRNTCENIFTVTQDGDFRREVFCFASHN